MSNVHDGERFEHERLDDALEVDRRLARVDRRTLRAVRKLDEAESKLAVAERRAREMTDHDFTQALVRGPLLGVPAIFALVLAIALFSGFSPMAAFFVAIWPAVVVGPYVGGLARLAYRADQLEAPARRKTTLRHRHGSHMKTA